MNEEIQKLSNDVVLELTELKKAGVKVSKKALLKAADLDEMSEYEGMTVSEAADLILDLY
jgi:hypothetical protein